MIFEASPVYDRFPLDNPGVGQGVEALAKQIAGYPRHTSMDVSEAPSAGQQFPQNQRRPALGENFRGQRHGTKLAISFHAVEHGLVFVFAQVQFLNFVQSSPRGRKKCSRACRATFRPSSAPTMVELR